MIEPARLSDSELVEALELSGPRARLATLDDLRHVADVLAGLAIEAARRLKELGSDRALLALRLRVSRLEDAAFHFQTCATCRRDGEGSCQSGRWFSAYLRGENEDESEQLPPGVGPVLGNLRNVSIDAAGVLTAELTMTITGREFLARVQGRQS